MDLLRTLASLGLVLLAASPCSATSPRLTLASAGEVVGDASAAGVSLRLDAAAYASLWHADAAVVGDFPLPGGLRVDLELSAFEVVKPGARFVDGAEPYVPPAMRHYHGAVAGEPGSRAYLWLRDGRIGGFVALSGVLVEDSSGLFLFGPRSPRFGEGESRDLVAAAYVPSVDGAQPFCHGAELADFGRDFDRRDPGPAGVASDTQMVASVAIDATSQFHRAFGNMADATAYVESLIGAVSTIYENEVNCQIQIGFLRIFSAEPDPYSDDGDTGVLINELASEWTTNAAVKDLPRAATHLLTRNTAIGGRAWLEALCNKSSGYGVSGLGATYVYPNPNYTWDADVVSHELGHNFGSPHTHCYVPAIDHCYNKEATCYAGPVEPIVGTIMSYCHLVSSKNLVFGQRVIDVIRPAIEAAICIVPASTTCTPSVTVLSAPVKVAPSADATIDWKVGDRNCPDLTHTSVHWDTVSHAGGLPGDYANETAAQAGPRGDYSATFTAPASDGIIYYLVHAQADPEMVSPESSIEVQSPTCYSLTLTAAPAQGGTFSLFNSADCGSKFTAGTTVTFKVTPAAGWVFTGWSGGASGMVNPLGMVLDADTAVTANLYQGKPAVKPALLSPAKASRPLGVTQKLDWSDVVGATRYELQVKKGSSSGSMILSDQTTVSERTVSGLTKGTAYYWRVRACNALGCTAWPSYFNFRPK